MSKLIVYTQDGDLKSIGINPKFTDKEIKEFAKKIVPKGIDYEIKTEEEYLNLPEKIAEKKRVEWLDKRLKGYGSINFQLDMIYHDGLDTWKEHIKKVKEENLI